MDLETLRNKDRCFCFSRFLLLREIFMTQFCFGNERFIHILICYSNNSNSSSINIYISQWNWKITALNSKNCQPFGRIAFLPIAFRRRFTSIVLSNRPSILTDTKSTIFSFILVDQEIVTLYFASGVNKGKRSTFSVKLCASYNFYEKKTSFIHSKCIFKKTHFL